MGQNNSSVNIAPVNRILENDGKDIFSVFPLTSALNLQYNSEILNESEDFLNDTLIYDIYTYYSILTQEKNSHDAIFKVILPLLSKFNLGSENQFIIFQSKFKFEYRKTLYFQQIMNSFIDTLSRKEIPKFKSISNPSLNNNFEEIFKEQSLETILLSFFFFKFYI